MYYFIYISMFEYFHNKKFREVEDGESVLGRMGLFEIFFKKIKQSTRVKDYLRPPSPSQSHLLKP